MAVEGIPREGQMTLSSFVLNGTVVAQGAAAPPSSRHVMMMSVVFTEPAGGSETGLTIVTFDGVISDKHGRFVVDLEGSLLLPDVSYDVRVKDQVMLSNIEEDVSVPASAESPPVEFRTLRAGDLDRNDVVNIFDFLVLKLGLGQGGETPDEPLP